MIGRRSFVASGTATWLVSLLTPGHVPFTGHPVVALRAGPPHPPPPRKIKGSSPSETDPPDKARPRINSPRFRFAGNFDGIDVWMPWERMGPGSCGLKGLEGARGEQRASFRVSVKLDVGLTGWLPYDASHLVRCAVTGYDTGYISWVFSIRFHFRFFDFYLVDTACNDLYRQTSSISRRWLSNF